MAWTVMVAGRAEGQRGDRATATAGQVPGRRRSQRQRTLKRADFVVETFPARSVPVARRR
jgi:hypothetical protein